MGIRDEFAKAFETAERGPVAVRFELETHEDLVILRINADGTRSEVGMNATQAGYLVTRLMGAITKMASKGNKTNIDVPVTFQAIKLDPNTTTEMARTIAQFIGERMPIREALDSLSRRFPDLRWYAEGGCICGQPTCRTPPYGTIGYALKPINENTEVSDKLYPVLRFDEEKGEN